MGAVTVEGLILLGLLIVPGAYARAAALRSTMVPWTSVNRSRLQELVEVLAYALINALLTALPLAAVAVAHFGHEEALLDLLNNGVASLDKSPTGRVGGFVWLVIYVGASLVVAEVSGSTQLLVRIRTFLASLFHYGGAEDTTIWHEALGTFGLVSAHVYMKDGSIFRGQISGYPIAEDSVEKDFLLAQAQEWDAEHEKFREFSVGVERELTARPPIVSEEREDRQHSEEDEGTRLLLNSRDCSAIWLGRKRERKTEAKEFWTAEHLILLVGWVALGTVAFWTLRRLIDLEEKAAAPILIDLLEYVAWLATIWSAFVLIQLETIRSSPTAWLKNEGIQRMWFMSGVLASLGAMLWTRFPSLEVGQVLVGPALVSVSVALGLLVPFVSMRKEPRASPGGDSGGRA